MWGDTLNTALRTRPESCAAADFVSPISAVSGVQDPSIRLRGLTSGAACASGYVARSETVDFVFNAALAGALLVLTAPLFASIVLMQKSTTRGDVFYRGLRIGHQGKRFEILKFRTLEPEAAVLTADRTLPRRNMIETPLGKYLRVTRLDELPQLLNVLRGDMALFGPRPVRPEIAQRCTSEIPNYDNRFSVKPGLIGLTQALMSHDTAKSIRARMNNMACRAPVNYFFIIGFMALVGVHIALTTIRTMGESISDFFTPLGEHRWLRAGFSRPSRTRVEAFGQTSTSIGALCGISDEIIQFVAPLPFPRNTRRLSIIRKLRGRRVLRVNVEVRIQSIAPRGPGTIGFTHYATYTIPNDFTRYKIDRYLIRAALISG